KSVAMTGWRFGYMAAADTELIKATKKLQSQSTSNINTITQKAAIAGLDGRADADVNMMKEAFIERRNEAVKLINEIDGLSVTSPDGAFYLFVNIKEVSSDSLTFAKELLDKKLVAVVPGVAFGSEGYFRMSFATDIDTIRTGIARVAEFVSDLRN
ncbi:MAG: aminotransferase class I/II-fold pyridoxal phosphate-dependent enzyme, partial [Sulfurimonas sp.]|nr:aminotransferase class I/II-fold pyridoxal phosphate-dependent enzyme [Sulfurimonas sp.]